MSIIADYGLELPVRAYLVLTLSVEDRNRKKASDILHLQKIVRYFEFLRGKQDVDFSNYKLGQVSYELEENMESLLETGLVERQDNVFHLTDDGRKAASELKAAFNQEDFRKLVFSKQQLNDLSRDELLFFMYELIPESREHSTEVDRLFKRDRELTESLFRKGRISAAMAAHWLGISEHKFFSSIRNVN